MVELYLGLDGSACWAIYLWTRLNYQFTVCEKPELAFAAAYTHWREPASVFKNMLKWMRGLKNNSLKIVKILCKPFEINSGILFLWPDLGWSGNIIPWSQYDVLLIGVMLASIC